MSDHPPHAPQKLGALIGLPVALFVLGVGGYVRAWRYRQVSHRSEPAAAKPPPAAGLTPQRVRLKLDLHGLPFQLIEASRRTGVVNTHQMLRPHPSLSNVAPTLRSLGAHVAVVDYDNDGWMDVYLTNSAIGSHNRLFRNNHDGTFTDVADRAGLGDVNGADVSVGALFFDYDNDGFRDLLLLGHPCSKLFHNNGDGTFTDVTKRSGFEHCGIATAANVVDYDSDGYLDIIIGDYFKPVNLFHPETMNFMPNSMVSADNGGPIAVYHNNRDGTFSRLPGSLGIKSRGWTQAIGVYDLRGTGRQDLWFATDYGHDQVYLNEGGGRFVDASKGVAHKYSVNAMSAEIADIDNDGRPTVYVTNIHEPPYRLGHDMLWKWDGAGFQEISWKRGVAQCGWAWGAKFVDLDNDGRQDLVVANGNISANPDKSYWYYYLLAFSGSGKYLQDARNWPPMRDFSLSGYQKKCVFYNRGGKFEDVTDLTGLADDRSDGRGLAAIDYLNNGSLSLVEANQGQPARFYHNEQRNRNHWIGFALTGTRSNRDAFGAEVAVRLKDKTLTRQLQPMNGFMSQSDPRLHFGLGAAPEIQSVTIRWPSGTVQKLEGKGLGLDRYHAVQEPR